jgi:hypothetical protein
VKNHKKSDQKYNDYIENNTGEMEKTKKHRVLLIGDSHTRGWADLTKKKLNKEFGVIGIVKPGAKSSDILKIPILIKK